MVVGTTTAVVAVAAVASSFKYLIWLHADPEQSSWSPKFWTDPLSPERLSTWVFPCPYVFLKLVCPWSWAFLTYVSPSSMRLHCMYCLAAAGTPSQEFKFWRYE